MRYVFFFVIWHMVIASARLALHVTAAREARLEQGVLREALV